MAKRLLDGYKIGGDIIDRVSPMAEAAFAVPSLPPKQNTVGRSPAVSTTGTAEEPDQPGATAATATIYSDRATIGGTDQPLTTVAEFYHRELTTNRPAHDYLTTRKLLDWPLIKRLGVGFADGRLVQTLTARHRETLKTWGVLHDSGHEVLTGCLVVPLKNAGGEVVGLYGRKINDTAKPHHLYLKGPHRGLVNREALSVWRQEIILTESVLDGLSLMTLGIERVLPCYGTNGFTAEHLAALKDAGVSKVVIAFDSDEAGRKGAATLTATLLTEGFGVAVIEPADAKDWNQALINGLTREAVESLIAAAAVTELTPSPQWIYQSTHQRWELTNADIIYKVSGVMDKLSVGNRLSVRIEKADKRHIDYLDLYSARSRKAFREQAALTLETEAALIEQDLLRLLDRLESSQAETTTPEIIVSEEDRALGMGFLTSPTLLDDLVADTEIMGHVGEEDNKKLVYLAASSRKLDDPINVVIVSQSAAGKSYLIDTIRNLMPPEDVVNLTSLSDQALNYMPEGGLVRKLLILGEAVHNATVEHQIREMLSAQELNRMAVGKDERTGKLVSKMVTHKAIVSLMMSTTNHEMNPENASRSFFVHADESEEQTRRIHTEQNKKYTLEAMNRRRDRVPDVVRKHQAAQRLLQPVRIINPFARDQQFPSVLMRSRRDNKQLNELTAAVCFLRQYQKTLLTTGELSFIECDETDVRTAWELFTESVMKATYLELPASLVKLYDAIRTLCHNLATETNLAITEVSFEQAQIRKAVKWLGSESIKKYLKKLVSLEYLVTKGGYNRGQRVKYQLVADESLEDLAGFDELHLVRREDTALQAKAGTG